MAKYLKELYFMQIKEILSEVRILPDQSPLLDRDTIRLYHGSSDLATIILALTRGLSGDGHAMRRYSYEANNNPKGLFVTPDLKTAKEFGDYILEIHARVSDLEAPVWPGGAYTVQGGYSELFNDPEEREQERLKQRHRFKDHEFDYIRDSDRPELAASLMLSGETQALFTGDLNSNSVRAVWASTNPTRVYQPYKRYSPKEFVKMFNSEGIDTRYGHKQSEISGDLVDTVKRRYIKPRDTATVDLIVTALKKAGYGEMMTTDRIVSVLKSNPEYARQLVWGDRQYNELMADLANYMRDQT